LELFARAAEAAPRTVHPIITPPNEVSFVRPYAVAVNSDKQAWGSLLTDSASAELVVAPSSIVTNRAFFFDDGFGESEELTKLREENLKYIETNVKLMGDIKVWQLKLDRAEQDLAHAKAKVQEKANQIRELRKENSLSLASTQLHDTQNKAAENVLLEQIQDLHYTVEALKAELIDEQRQNSRLYEFEASMESRLGSVDSQGHRDTGTVDRQWLRAALVTMKGRLIKEFFDRVVMVLVRNICELTSDFLAIQERISASYASARSKKYALTQGVVSSTDASLRHYREM
jgi:hypothetical protein